jgi:hypothetical protein
VGLVRDLATHGDKALEQLNRRTRNLQNSSGGTARIRLLQWTPQQ